MWVEGELDKIKRGKKEAADSYSARRNRRLQEILAPKVQSKGDDKKQFAEVKTPRRWKGGKNG